MLRTIKHLYQTESLSCSIKLSFQFSKFSEVLKYDFSLLSHRIPFTFIFLTQNVSQKCSFIELTLSCHILEVHLYSSQVFITVPYHLFSSSTNSVHTKKPKTLMPDMFTVLCQATKVLCMSNIFWKRNIHIIYLGKAITVGKLLATQ